MLNDTPPAEKRLVVRSDPITDESFAGYIVRLTELNHYDTPYWILKLASLDRQYLDAGCSFLFEESFDFSLLAQIGGTDTVSLQLLAHPPGSNGRSSNARQVFGISVLKGLIRLRYPKVCVRCLRESLHCRKIWDLAPVTACPVHRVMLLDKCQECGKRIRWARKRVSICSCGQNWLKYSPPRVDCADLGMIRQIYRLCGLIGERETYPALVNSPILILDVGHMLEAVYIVAKQYAGGLQNRHRLFSSMRNSDLHELLVKAFKVFQNWPNNYHGFLGWCREREDAGPVFKGLTSSFGSFYRHLYRDVRSEELNFMRDEFEEYVYRNWCGAWVFNKNRLRDRSSFKSRYMSKTDVVQKLGIAAKTIPNLIRLGELRAVTSLRGEENFDLIETRSVEEFRGKIESSVTLPDAARLLGLRDIQVGDLVRRKCLSAFRGPLIDGAHAWLFSRESLDSLLNTISSKCLTLKDADSTLLVSLYIAMRMFVRCDFDTTDLVRAILDNKIVPYRDKIVGICHLKFSKKQIYDFASALRQEQRGQNYYLKELPEMLGFASPIPIHFLVRKGVLKAERRVGDPYSKWLVTKEAIEEFRCAYEVLPKLAQEASTSPIFLGDLLMRNGVLPVSGPKVDGGVQYIFRKTDLDGLDLKRMVTSARRREMRRDNKIIAVDSKHAAHLLGLTEKMLTTLVRNGVLAPTCAHRPSVNRPLFNLSHVERLRNYPVPLTAIISLPKAAALIGQEGANFCREWVRSGYLKLVPGDLHRRFLLLKDVRKLAALRKKTLSTSKAAKSLGVGSITLLKFVRAGKLKAIQKSGVNEDCPTLFWSKDIEEMRRSLQQTPIRLS